MWGNDLTATTGYTNSNIISGAATSVYDGTALNVNREDEEYHWGLAIWNSVDNAARNIRLDSNYANRAGDTSGLMNTRLYVIGYTGNGGCDAGLLKRVANDITAPGYDSSQPRGQYYSASNAQELSDAYNRLASDLLRLAR